MQLFVSLLVLPTALFWSPPSQAKDLSHRFGLGASNLGPALMPTLSLDWQATQATAFELDFGVDTQASSSALQLGVRYYRNLYIEDNLFYHLYLGGGLMSLTTEGSNSAGYLLESGIGTKFFLSGMPNLSLDAGAGFRLESASAIRFRTSFFGGFYYYF